jgi:hypothetical protein
MRGCAPLCTSARKPVPLTTVAKLSCEPVESISQRVFARSIAMRALLLVSSNKASGNVHHPRDAGAGPDKAMRIALYWILFLGQTIGDATILSQLIPLFRRLVTSRLYEKTPPKILLFAALPILQKSNSMTSVELIVGCC